MFLCDKKLEYRFFVESTKIENTSFPYKTAILEASVKTNRMVSTKWTWNFNLKKVVDVFVKPNQQLHIWTTIQLLL